jgi:hypothetical protein
VIPTVIANAFYLPRHLLPKRGSGTPIEKLLEGSGTPSPKSETGVGMS